MLCLAKAKLQQREKIRFANLIFNRSIPGAKMEPSDLTAKEAFTSDDHTELNFGHFSTEDESVLTGTWDCAPCREDIDTYPVHELMTVVKGVRVSLTRMAGLRKLVLAIRFS